MKLTILIASPIFGLINKKFHNTIFNSKDIHHSVQDFLDIFNVISYM